MDQVSGGFHGMEPQTTKDEDTELRIGIYLPMTGEWAQVSTNGKTHNCQEGPFLLATNIPVRRVFGWLTGI